MRGEWCDVVGQQVVRCVGRVGGAACEYVVARGVPRRKQVRQVTRPVLAVALLIATVLVWVGGVAACATGAFFGSIELYSTLRHGGGLSAWTAPLVLFAIGGCGAAVVGAWMRIVREDGAHWKRWVLFVLLALAWMGSELALAKGVGDMVSGRNLSGALPWLWVPVPVLALMWWAGALVGALLRWIVAWGRSVMWKRGLQRARHMRPQRA